MAATAADSGTTIQDGNRGLDADAFRKLYPEDYFQSFLADGIRPDGRVLGRARPTTIGLNTISTADGSALVKQGETTILAGVQMSIEQREDGSPEEGGVTTKVEFAPFSCADWRAGRAPELAASVSEHLDQVLLGRSAWTTPPSERPRRGVFCLSQLAIPGSKTARHATLNVYVLNADGSVFDAVLLAAVAALRAVAPADAWLQPGGKVVQRGSGKAAPEGATRVECPRLQLRALPLALTCGLYQEHVLVDPTAEEESLSHCHVAAVVDEHGTMHGTFQTGGRQAVKPQDILRCVESARLRHAEVSQLLQQALDELEEEHP